MSNAFADAIMSNMAASINPEAQATREAMKGYVQQQKHELLVAKSNSVLEISTLLTRAKEDKGGHPAVIAALEKILVQMSQ